MEIVLLNSFVLGEELLFIFYKVRVLILNSALLLFSYKTLFLFFNNFFSRFTLIGYYFYKIYTTFKSISINYFCFSWI